MAERDKAMMTSAQVDAPVSPAGTVLVVDDDPFTIELISQLLRPSYRVRAAKDGEHALRLLAEPSLPDLVLLDVMMPGIDGFETLGRIRADPAIRDVPVIMVTALNADADEERGLSMGAVDYIAKPIRPAILLARVAGQIERKLTLDRLQDQNAYLVKEVALRALRNDIVEEASIHALAALAEARDSETGAHLYRTQAYMNLLAQRLQINPRFAGQLDDARRELIARAALLHDIGKVCIPDHILLKPGRLTPAEFEIMKTHAQLGADAIGRAIVKVENSLSFRTTPEQVHASIAFLDIARQIACSHHERWDGQGYPHGLAGEAIPLPARLMALVDVFDALSTRRVYRTPMSMDALREKIREGRGTAFDPTIVDALFEVWDEFVQTARRYPDPEGRTAHTLGVASSS